MIYDPENIDNLIVAVTYGSHLYGTNTPASDHDFKVIVLPSYRSLILAKPLHVQRFRFDAEGKVVGAHDTMPANGYEAEHTPVQKFVHDYLGGQAYAVEIVFAVLQGYHKIHMERSHAVHLEEKYAGWFVALCDILAHRFQHRNVNGMVGFAVKQTFDYVRRGERLNAARAVLSATNGLTSLLLFYAIDRPRLDTIVEGISMLDRLASATGLETGIVTNNNHTMRTLKLNGREYLETTTLTHFHAAVEKLIDQYGDRSTKASETNVDWKSLSHAVRVYEQVMELLQTGWITFPRPNAEALLRIRRGECELESVKDLLRDLDDNVAELLAETDLPEVNETFRTTVDDVLFTWLADLY